MGYNAKSILEVIINLQQLCKGSSNKIYDKDVLSVKNRILFLIFINKKISPSLLVEKLGIAKSNIANFCKKLVNEQLVLVQKDDVDKRGVFYCLTKSGENLVKKNLEQLEKNIILNKEKFNIKEFKDAINSLLENINS